MKFVVPFLTLLFLPCLLLWHVVFGGEVFVPADLLRDVLPWRSDTPASLVPWNPLMWDSVAEFYPWRAFAAETLKSGFLPLWNPHQFCGTPFVANSQSAVFYPLNLLFCLLPVAEAFGISVLLHLFLTGVFAYLFLRSPALGLGRPASLLGAIAWQLCHWQVAWLALPTFLCVSAWMPLALLLVDRAVESSTPKRAVPLGLCLGLMLLAGHLQIALYCLGLITAYAVFRILPSLKTQWLALLGCAVVTVFLALGVAAPQILPSVELAHVSHRAVGPATWASYQGYTRLAVPLASLVTLFLPGFFGNPTAGTYWGIFVKGLALNGGAGAYMENAGYSGLLTLLLALAGLWATGKTSTTTRFFAFAAVVSLLLALGTPLNALPFFGIPGFAQTGSPGRILVLWSFCVPILAATGTQAMLKGRGDALFKGGVLFLFLGLLALGYAVAWSSQHLAAGTLAAYLSLDNDLWRVPFGLLVGAAAGFWLWRRGSLKTSLFGGVLCVLVAGDLLTAGFGFNRSTAPKNVYPVTPLIAFLQAHRSEGRIMPLNRRWSLYEPPLAVLPPNAATVFGLYDTQGYDSLLTGRYFQFAGAMDGGSPAPQENGNMVFTSGYGSPEASAAAVRFVVSREPLTDSYLTLRMQENGVYLYENQEALTRLRIATAQEKFDLMSTAPTRVEFKGNGNRELTSITVADQWYPGWRAHFDGLPVSLTPEPYVFCTLRLTPPMKELSQAGVNVDLRYEPMAFRIGLYALCLALGTAAALATAAWTKN